MCFCLFKMFNISKLYTVSNVLSNQFTNINFVVIGDRPHKCLHCHKSFITKDTLSKHLSVHNESRNFKCGQCGKLFKRISHVREHLKIHSVDRPFMCTVCHKAFKTNVRVHSVYNSLRLLVSFTIEDWYSKT